MPEIIPAFLTFRDFSGEASSMSFNLERPADDADLVPDTEDALSSLQFVVDSVTGGVLVSSGYTVLENAFPNLPADPTVQREKKWLVTYRDVQASFTSAPSGDPYPNPNYGKLFTMEIPTATLNTTLVDRKDNWTYNEFTGQPAIWADFKSNFEQYVKSPSGGDVVITNVRFVGRNT